MEQKQTDNDLYSVDGVLDELFDTNHGIQEEFRAALPTELHEFVKAFNSAYNVFGHAAAEIQITDQGYFGWRLMHSALDDLLTSVKLMAAGYHSASGNLVRQAAEGICRAEMCAHDTTLNIEGAQQLYWNLIVANHNHAFGHRAIGQLNINHMALHFSPTDAKRLVQVNRDCNSVSHSSMTAQANRIDTRSGALTFGGHFEPFKVDDYRKGLNLRIEVTQIAEREILRLVPTVRAGLKNPLAVVPSRIF